MCTEGIPGMTRAWNILEKIVTVEEYHSHMASEVLIPFTGAEVHICINMECINFERRNNEKSKHLYAQHDPTQGTEELLESNLGTDESVMNVKEPPEGTLFCSECR